MLLNPTYHRSNNLHAILITPDNLEKIRERVPESDYDKKSLDVYVNLTAQWYMIQSYVSRDGVWYDFTIFPDYIVETSFIHDKEKLKTDWDTIYHLA